MTTTANRWVSWENGKRTLSVSIHDNSRITLPSGMVVGVGRGLVMVWCLTRLRSWFWRGLYDLLTKFEQDNQKKTKELNQSCA